MNAATKKTGRTASRQRSFEAEAKKHFGKQFMTYTTDDLRVIAQVSTEMIRDREEGRATRNFVGKPLPDQNVLIGSR